MLCLCVTIVVGPRLNVWVNDNDNARDIALILQSLNRSQSLITYVMSGGGEFRVIIVQPPTAQQFVKSAAHVQKITPFTSL